MRKKQKITCIFQNLFDLCKTKKKEKREKTKIFCVKLLLDSEFKMKMKDISKSFCNGRKLLPLSESLSIISFNVASSWDTDLLIIPTHMSVGTLVSDQSLTAGGELRAGKLYRKKQHRKWLKPQQWPQH